MIRQLSFRNGAGERWGLNGQQDVYASDLSGFGLELAPDFNNLHRGFFSPIQEELEPQIQAGMTLTFTRNPYPQYRALINWLASAGTLTLIYNPDGTQEYWRDITPASIQKGELDVMGWLSTPCTFLCLTPWYLPVPTDLILDTDEDPDVLRYPYVYTPELHYGADSHAALSGKVSGSGHIPGALRLTVTGTIINPEFNLVDNQTGQQIGSCRVAVSLAEGEQLIFSTRYEESFVKKISASGQETDLLDVLDITADPFFHIPVTGSYTFSIQSEAEISAAAQLQLYYYYRSV